MSGSTYIGVNNTATIPKKIFVGVDGIAHEVKAIFAGVNNIAKRVWTPAIPSGYKQVEWVITPVNFTETTAYKLRTNVNTSINPRIIFEFDVISGAYGPPETVIFIDGHFYTQHVYDPATNAVFETLKKNEDDTHTIYHTQITEGILTNNRYIVDYMNDGKTYLYSESGYYSIPDHNYLCDGYYLENKSIEMFYTTRGYSWGYARIYGAQIFEGNGLIRDFVPSYRISDGMIGYFDLVNLMFYSIGIKLSDQGEDDPDFIGRVV